MTALRGWDRAAGPIPGPRLRPSGRPRPAFHPRMVAAATAASCLVHLWLVAGNHHGPWLNLLMLAMVGVCLPCAVHIWRDGRVGSLRQVMACGLAMTVLHAALLLGGGPVTAQVPAAGRPATATGPPCRRQRLPDPRRVLPLAGCWPSSPWKSRRRCSPRRCWPGSGASGD